MKPSGSEFREVVRRVANDSDMKELERAVEGVRAEVARVAALKGKDALLTSKEIAPVLGLKHHKTVEDWVREKRVPCVHLGRNLRFRLGDVLQWRDQQR